MARFVKITEPEISGDHVTLWVHGDKSAQWGQVTLPVVVDSNFEIKTADLPIKQAVSDAARTADKAGVHVNVVDPDDLWQPEWGRLEA